MSAEPYELGKVAHAAGLPRAPVCDPKMFSYVAALLVSREDGPEAEALRQWHNGWKDAAEECRR